MPSNYLKFFEEHQGERHFSLFEKVIMTAQRAKSLYELDEPSRVALIHKPTYQAILESNEGKIQFQKNKKVSKEAISSKVEGDELVSE